MVSTLINDLTKFLSENATLTVLGAITLVQVTPLKIDPWSKIFSTIGGWVNSDVNKKLNEIDGRLAGVESQLDETKGRLDRTEEEKKERERNNLRDRLLQAYKYYCGKNNPMKAITELESETFWEMFKDYETLHGDGYMHSTVQSEMLNLDVVRMDDKEGIARLMESRG